MVHAQFKLNAKAGIQKQIYIDGWNSCNSNFKKYKCVNDGQHSGMIDEKRMNALRILLILYRSECDTRASETLHVGVKKSLCVVIYSMAVRKNTQELKSIDNLLR